MLLLHLLNLLCGERGMNQLPPRTLHGLCGMKWRERLFLQLQTTTNLFLQNPDSLHFQVEMRQIHGNIKKYV